jgi:hypothetical protein
VIEGRGLEDDLDAGRRRGLDHAADVLEHGLVVLGLERAEVDDHVDLARALADRVAGLVGLGGRRHRAEREADDAAHHHVGAGQERLAQPDPRGVDAHRREAVLLGLGAQRHDLVAGGVGA